MHGNLEPEESVFSSNIKSSMLTSQLKWDLEDCKKAYLDNAKEYDRLMEKEEEDE